MTKTMAMQHNDLFNIEICISLKYNTVTREKSLEHVFSYNAGHYATQTKHCA